MTAGLFLAAILAFASPGSGGGLHAALRASDPAHNAHLATPPKRLTLWFTERPQIPFSHVQLTGPNGDVTLGKLAADTGKALKADILGAMPSGTYKVVWKTGGSDGHAVTGDFSFMVAGPTEQVHATPLESSHSSTASAMPQPVGVRLVRLLEFMGLLVVLGVLVFVHGVLPPLAQRGVHTSDAEQRARRLGEALAIVYVAAAGFRLVFQAQAVGAPAASPIQALTDIVTRSNWGNAWLLGELGALLVILGLWFSIRRMRAGMPTALTGALAMTLSPALSGHAAAAKMFVPSVTLDALHVAAVGAWLGTLSVVVLIGIPAMARVKDGNAHAAVSALVNSFHPIALLAAPMAVLAGLGSSAFRLGSIRALTDTPYGTALIVKLIGVALLAAFGAWNSMRARRRLGTPGATTSIRRTAMAEVLLAVLVLWATTDLVGTPVPSELAQP